MEVAGYTYLSQFQVLLCKEHGVCVTKKGYRRHLWSLHALKGDAVQAVVDEVSVLALQDDPTCIPTPPPDSPPIPDLLLRTFFRCAMPNCDKEVSACSQRRETVMKHQARRHNVGRRKGTQPQTWMIETISMQSFFPHPLLQWFQVQVPSPTPCSAGRGEHDDRVHRTQEQIRLAIRTSKESCEDQLNQLSTAELHATQTPPWLQASGIAPFLGRLGLDKTELYGLREMPASPAGWSTTAYLVNGAVLFGLQELRLLAKPGYENRTVSRVVLRHFSSFEPDRMQAKPFYGTQHESTTETYGTRWMELITFLLRVQEREDQDLAERLLPNDSIQSLLIDVTDAAEALHAVNEDERIFEDCFQPGQPETRALEPLATTLLHAVTDLSVALIRQRRQQDVFSSPVLAYCSTLALDRHGAWVPATRFRPFLSEMIHCMQLWLLGFCIQESRNNTEGLTLLDLAKIHCQETLINTAPTPLGELSHWRLLCRSSKNDTPRPPVTTVAEDCMQVQHGLIELRLPAWRQFLRELLQEATQILDEGLLFGLEGLKAFPVTSLYDNPSDSQPGKSFLNDPRNGLHAVRDDVCHQVEVNSEIRPRFFKDSTVHAVLEDLQYHRLAMTDYLDQDQRFLQIVAILILMTSGLPPRQPELIGIRWFNGEVIRNIFIYNGLLAIFTSYHKSQWRVGNRPVARFLPPCVGDLLVRYLIYVPSVTTLFYHCMQMPNPQGTLFAGERGLWSARAPSAAMKSYTERLLRISFGISSWRHIAIALDRRLLQGVSCQVYCITPNEVSGERGYGSDSDDDDFTRPSYPGQYSSLTARSVHALQAAHTVATNATHYGNTSYPLATMTDSLLADFCAVSRQWHQLTQLPSSELIACSQKRPVSLTAEQASCVKRPLHGARLFARRELWTWPTLEKGWQTLFGPKASPRDSMQRNALRLLASNHSEIIIIMPTGGGKTVLYMVLSVIMAAEVTVVIIPLIALKQDLCRRCRELHVPYWQYNEAEKMQERLHAVPSLVLVDVEMATTTSFMVFLKQLSDQGRLDRLIIDEAHLVIIASDYRNCLGLLATLRQVPCPIVCLTATLPPLGEFDLNQSLLLKDPVIYRTCSDRPMLEYCIERLPRPPKSFGQNELIVLAAVQLIDKSQRRWQSVPNQNTATARSLCFVRTIEMGSSLAKSLHCGFYHAKLTAIERASILTAWSHGDAGACLVATSALGAGVDYPSIRQIVHVDAPSGMVAYAQETGRAGRDGLHAVCTILLPPRWRVDWDRHYRNDFLIEDCKQMDTYLRSKECLRQQLTNYLDGSLGGRDGTPCNYEDKVTRVDCSNCCQTRLSRSMNDSGSMQSPRQKLLRPPPQAILDLPTDESVSPGVTRELPTPQRLPTMVQPTPEPPEQRILHAIDENRLRTLENAEKKALYRSILSAWGRVCILCSFRGRQRIPFPHEGCIQPTFQASMDQFRRAITFVPGVGCYNCAQPMAICMQKGRTGACQFPWFVFHCCWVALHEDTSYAVDLVRVIGGPDLGGYAVPELHPRYVQWLGGSHRLFNAWNGSNALRMAWLWSDRLHTLYNPTASS